MSECQTKAGNQECFEKLSLLALLSLFHSLYLDMLNNFYFHLYAQKSLSHSVNLSFTHSRHAEQVLFSSLCSKVAVNRRKLQWVFFYLLTTRSTDIRVHRAGSQLKNVWMSDKSWEPGMFWKTFTFTTFTLSFTLSRHAEQLLFSCLCQPDHYLLSQNG